MSSEYQACWVSKPRADALKRKGAFLLDSFNGIILVEPVGANQGDGAILTIDEMEYELQPVWVQESKSKLEHARRLLLGAEAHTAVG